MAIADFRKDYRLLSLDRENLVNDPLAQFNRWFDDAAQKRHTRLRRFGIHIYKAFSELFGSNTVLEANAMALATADAAGKPSARTVLLKGVDERGFTFFTNYASRKGRELEANPNAALVFYWPSLERQVCIAGPIQKVSREETEQYFQSRPRGSRLGAWASEQSTIVPNRQFLEDRFKQIEADFASKDIPAPPYWGGYLLMPTRVEFWQGRPSRLHDRFQYTRDTNGNWEIERLSP